MREFVFFVLGIAVAFPIFFCAGVDFERGRRWRR